MHSTDDAVSTEASPDDTSAILLAIGRDYAKYAAPSGMQHRPGQQVMPSAEGGYKETVQVLQMERDASNIPIRVLAIAESPHPFGSSIFQCLKAAIPEDELVNHHDQWPREILVLKEDGLQSYLKMRPIEWMAIYLEFPQWAGFRDEMFCEYGKDEGCAMCFALACGDFSYLPRESVLQSLNREKIRQNAIGVLCSSDRTDLIGRDVLENHQYALGNNPQQGLTEFGEARAVQTNRHSHRFKGLVAYSARLLEPVWEHKITQITSTLPKRPPFTLEPAAGQRPDPNAVQDLRLRNREQWNSLVVALDAVIAVMEKLYPASDLAPPGFIRGDIAMAERRLQGALAGVAIDQDRESYRTETRLVFGLYQLLRIAREAGKLFRILCRTDIAIETFLSRTTSSASLSFALLVSKLRPHEQEALSQLTFRDLIVNQENRRAGKPLNKVLHELVTLAKDKNSDFGAWFIRDCPTFFGEPDQGRLKARDLLQNADKMKRQGVPAYEWKTKVEDAMQEYRKVVYYTDPRETATMLSNLGRYSEAIEIALLKAARSLMDKEKSELFELSIKLVHNVWVRKFGPSTAHTEPPMISEEVDEQWRQCLDNALYFGGVQMLKDAQFYTMLFESFCRLPGSLGRSHLVDLARTHAQLVDPHLFDFLREKHPEDLHRAYQQAGRLVDAAYHLKSLAEEPSAQREEKIQRLKELDIRLPSEAQNSDLLELRVRWTSQAILNIEGSGMQEAQHLGSTRSMADLLQLLTDTKEVLEVQVYLKNALLSVHALAPEHAEHLTKDVLTNTEMWELLEQRDPSDPEPRPSLWQKYKLYGECLRVLSLVDETGSDRYREKVQMLWRMIIEWAYNRDGKEGIMNNVEHWGRCFAATPSAFPLQYIVELMENASYQISENAATEPMDLKAIGWVTETMHGRIRIPYSTLFDRYKSLLSNPLWQPRANQLRKQVHVLKAAAQLLKLWLNSSSSDDIADLSTAQIDFEDFQMKLTTNLQHMDQHERQTLEKEFKDAMERRRHLQW